MLKQCQAMISDVLQIIRSAEDYVPLGNHSTFQKSWQEETEHIVHQTLQEEFLDKKQVESTFDFIQDAYSLFLQHATNPPWQSLSREQRYQKIAHLKAKPQIEQRSEEWYRNFQHVLTASEFSTLFSNNKKRQDLLTSKAFPRDEDSLFFRTACPTDEMSPFGWGIRFEPVVKQIFEYENKCKIFEPGRLQHSTNLSLAASPDGIIEEAEDLALLGRLIEIKCPYSRKIGGEIPMDYWIQMQIQMEVTDIDECEYIEVEILSRKPKDTCAPDFSNCRITGVLWLMKQIVEEDMPFEYKYIYSPLDNSENQPHLEGYECLERIPWGLKAYHRKVVQRDRAWYISTLAWQEIFWRDVEERKIKPLSSNNNEPCLFID